MTYPITVKDVECGFGEAETKKLAQNEAARCAGIIMQNTDVRTVLSFKDTALFAKHCHVITAALAKTKLQPEFTDEHSS